jgi:O-acetylhomoserine (thiol)-lyase
MTKEELASVGIYDSTIRLSIGTEHIDDILEDLSNALNKI